MSKNWRDEKPFACPDDDWLEKWAPPCPDGNPQRLLEILGFRLTGEDYLQIRVVLTKRDHGVCQLIVDEHPDVIYVRAIACFSPGRARKRSRRLADETDCPCNWWLDAPLGERAIIDVDDGEELPYFIPGWGTCRPNLYVPRPPGILWSPDDVASGS